MMAYGHEAHCPYPGYPCICKVSRKSKRRLGLLTAVALLGMAVAAQAQTVTPSLGSAAYYNVGTSGATVPLLNGANTWTATQTVSGSSFGLSGNITAAAWTTSGIRYKNVGGTLTDTTSSGVVAAAYSSVWGGNTIAASSATTYTQYVGAFFGNPTAGTNVTFTNRSALGADTISIGGAAQGSDALAVTGSATFSGNVIGSTFIGGFQTTGPSGGINSNFIAATGIAATSSTDSSIQLAGATTTGYRGLMNGATATTLTAGASYSKFVVSSGGITEAASGTHPLLANVALKAPVFTDGAATTTNTASLYVEGAPTGVTPTGAAYAIYAPSGANRLDGGLGIGTDTGTNTPINILSSATNGARSVLNTNTNTGGSALAAFIAANGSGNTEQLRISALSSGYTTSGPSIADSGQIFARSGLSAGLVIGTEGTAPIDFFINNVSLGQMTTTGLNGMAIGATTRSTAAFTTLAANSTVTLSGLTTDATLTTRTVCQDTGTNVLYFGSGASGVCLGTSSARFKQHIVPIEVGLDEVLRLKAVTFNYLPGLGYDPAKPYYGFIAEQVIQTIPHVVENDKQGRAASVDYLALVPVLAKAIQQQQEQIDQLRKRVAILEAKP